MITIKNTQVTKYLSLAFSTVLTVFFLSISFSYFSEETTCILALFNIIFVPLTFSLNASITRKTLMLAIGNCAGISWNYLFSLFVIAGVDCFGDSFNTLSMIINPFLNIIWIISFWSITLTVVSPNSKTNVRNENDN